MPSPGVRLIALLSVGAAVLAVRPAAAQPVPAIAGEQPTNGLEIPTRPVAGDAEAWHVTLNPSNLGFLPAWTVNLLYTWLDPDGARGPGGFGLYAASPIPYLRSLVLGAAVELARPPGAFPYGDQAIISLALAYRPVRALSLGFRYLHVAGAAPPGVDGSLDSLDLSATLRLGRHVAFGLVVRDVPAPIRLEPLSATDGGLSLQRVYEPELVLRPTGNDHLEIAAAVRVGERRGDWSPRLRLASQPVAGLVLRGSLEFVPSFWNDPALPDGGSGLDRLDFRATAGLELNLAHFGVGTYALFGGRTGDARFDGVTVTARASGDRWPALFGARRLERVDLDKVDERRLLPLLAHLRRLEDDARTEGIVVVMGQLDAGWATMEELRDAFRRLRAADKHVYVYAAELSTRSYYAALAAERIYLDPAGSLRLVGTASTTLYLKGALDKLSVDAEFVKIAEYKSAPEQYTRTGPSPEAAQVRASLLDDVYGRLLAAIAEARHVTVEEAGARVDAGPYTPTAALKAHLVDELRGGDQVEQAIGERLGHHVEARAPETSPRRARSWATPAIGVLIVEGDLVAGKSQTIPLIGRRLVGHETLLRAIAELRADSRVGAIVVRVDSPGGSALAADVVAQELERTRKVKPVVCSLGDTAASGGYFIAAACDRIYASPSTITGSIGIFTGKVDLSGLAARVGVNPVTSGRGAHADQDSLWRPYTDEERARILEELRYYYGRFLETVARGRHLRVEEVDAVARGRVWTGAQAGERKLVDAQGGFLEALAEARRRAGLKERAEAELLPYPREPASLLGQLARLLGISVEAPASPLALLPSIVESLRAVPASMLLAPSTPQAWMPPF